MVNAGRVIVLFLNWWQQPLLSNPLPSLEVAATTLHVAPGWVKPVLVTAGACTARVLQLALRTGSAVAPVQLPPAAPPIWRATWFVLTTVLSLAGPPAIKACRALVAAAKKRQTPRTGQGIDNVNTSTSMNVTSDDVSTEDSLSAEHIALALLLPSLALAAAVGAFVRRRHRSAHATASAAASKEADSIDTVLRSPSTDASAASKLRQPLDEHDLSTPRRLAFGAEEYERAVLTLRQPPGLRPAFNTWAEATLLRMHAIQLMRRALCRMGQRSLATGWQSWVHTANRLRAERTTIERSLRYFLHGQMARCWITWVSAVSELARQEGVRQNAYCEWMHWRHRAAWSLWCEWVAVRQLISVFDQDRISRAWARWAVLVMSPADRSLMNHAARVFTHRFLVRSWATWAEATQRQRRKLRRLRTAASEWMGSRRRAAWLSWREMAAERRVMRAAAQSFRTPNLHRACQLEGSIVVAAQRKAVASTSRTAHDQPKPCHVLANLG